MAPTIGRLALDNGFHGSIPEDWVALPPQNIQSSFEKEYTTGIRLEEVMQRTFFHENGTWLFRTFLPEKHVCDYDRVLKIAWSNRIRI